MAIKHYCSNCGAQKQIESKHYQCCGYIGDPIESHLIETEVWIQNPEKKDFVQYQGQRTVDQVYTELESQVREKFESVEETGFDYISLEHEYRAKDTLFPKGYICVFVLPGSSEAYRINLCVNDANGNYTQVASCKVWSLSGAHDVCKYIWSCFYGENGRG